MIYDHISTRLLHITPLERRILQLLANERPQSELAYSLGLDVPALDALLNGLFARMGVSGAAAAVESASRRGLLIRADVSPMF